jgi:hypothetical protein
MTRLRPRRDEDIPAMKTTLFLTAAALTLASAATAQTVIKERETGVYSAPVAGATPQARENPSSGTTVLQERERTTVVQPRTQVIETRPVVVEQPRVVIEERPAVIERRARIVEQPPAVVEERSVGTTEVRTRIAD